MTEIHGQQVKHNHKEKKIVRLPYKERAIGKYNHRNGLTATTKLFVQDLPLFDKDMSIRYGNATIRKIIVTVLKKCALAVILDLWKMNLPHGLGLMYMKESVRTYRGRLSEWKADTDRKKENLLREIKRDLSRVYLRWNRDGCSYRHRLIYMIKTNSGFFAKALYNEVKQRAEDPTKKNYRGHII